MHKVAEVEIQNDILLANRKLARKNQRRLDRANVFAVDFLGAIGSGKTTLIEKLIENMDRKVAVIAGDVISKFDAGRFEKYDVPVVGLNTGKECHLDAHLVEHGLEDLPLDDVDLLFIENVGNLICPVDFDLGSHMRVVVVSSTEGDDTVEKHPLIFREADLVVINKADLAEAVGADLDKMVDDVKKINPEVRVIKTSLKTGDGVQEIIEAIEGAMAD
ncbi:MULTISPECIES: hydrogenase nickel incorporation protein HypB [Methanothermobacter]|jgi:hydrogenase nickel incorporation protein HypB|uniref:Hydrogenase expression/formation protein HypB n=3 Tax=Methanothermobacter TaxID=145260 RepID=O26875_METTH|nr:MULTISPECIES: hydrogenase nickel incorporation protein HypB [Methanothermobacter]MBC7111487.1 hydrogenase nickel incorporation protein HypB [Methanothermobacter sp.]AAB85284.1 hydrogenase expression/formation protein HypB [Methanothermobacter thermautotrophicus str. Delta H]MDI6818962.1 hydrogenase nickel incorporation protein HypB [Methanothermobacter thermautotrophicus]MDK2874423.1 hydrogenase nickel incorporation protein HypB [Methanothermobacter sp.]MDN5373507.1 hydrogenase nickel incor